MLGRMWNLKNGNLIFSLSFLISFQRMPLVMLEKDGKEKEKKNDRTRRVSYS